MGRDTSSSQQTHKPIPIFQAFSTDFNNFQGCSFLWKAAWSGCPLRFRAKHCCDFLRFKARRAAGASTKLDVSLPSSAEALHSTGAFLWAPGCAGDQHGISPSCWSPLGTVAGHPWVLEGRACVWCPCRWPGCSEKD